MKEQKHIRNLRNALHQIYMTITLWDKKITCIGEIRKRVEGSKEIDPKFIKKLKYGVFSVYIDAIYIIDRYNISEEEVAKIYYEEDAKRSNFGLTKNFQKTIITRDNKSAVNKGSWGSNCNKIRYPSKKRPLSTWKRFYKLFPHQAELDNWDGVTSNKMK